MNDIHIVWNDKKEGVITRLMKTLADYTGWTIGKKPRKSADLNYFGLYITAGKKRFTATPTGAWFTHHESNRPKKSQWWDNARAWVDVRTTSSKLYYDNLRKAGDTYLVTPPIDPQFVAMRKPRIGISGFVHPQGRKGEHLVERLYAEHSDRWDIVASGHGWACPTEFYRWADMPSFYQSLDVYLCTATVEGIPMPPLEALAIGKMLVIPRNVGILDDLPVHDNIYRYDAGDYDGMLKALYLATSRFQAIQDICKVYTPEAWAKSHINALTGDTEGQAVLSKATTYKSQIIVDTKPQPLPENHNPTRTDCGVVYVAYGDKAWDCVQRAATSFAYYMPDYPIAIVSDKHRDIQNVTYIPIELPDKDIGARQAKLSIYDHVPKSWQKVLYLDADTEVIADISWLYTILDKHDLFICTNPFKYRTVGAGKRPDNHDELTETVHSIGHEDYLQPNGGVFGFRRKTTAEFFARWQNEWQRYGKRDQMALIRAMWGVPLRVFYLTNAWNTITRYQSPNESAGILHYPTEARRWTGQIDGRLDSQKAWDKVDSD